MSVVFNENDPFASQWLRNLFPGAKVDDRSIVDVRPEDLVHFRRVHLFGGIGGWQYALSLAGWDDDREVWTGSCPCQPFSVAGEGKGESDARHLWPEFRRLVAQQRPATIFGEQVASKLGREWLAGVRADLEALGYAVGSADLCAASVGAPHIRQRLYWVADANGPERGRWRESGREHGGAIHASDSGGTGGMADTAGTRSGSGHGEADAIQDGDGPSGSCIAGRLADSRGAGIRMHRQRADDGAARGTEGAGTEREWHDEDESRSVAAAGCIDAWGGFHLIPCRDGKTRRVESSIQPLAHGISGRVGLLRGYGNAIVPQLAAEFIKAFLEAEEIMHAGAGATR